MGDARGRRTRGFANNVDKRNFLFNYVFELCTNKDKLLK
jgi:hypothetical protein